MSGTISKETVLKQKQDKKQQPFTPRSRGEESAIRNETTVQGKQQEHVKQFAD